MHDTECLLFSCILCAAVVTKVAADELYIVVNAGCREKDLAHIGKHLAAFKVSGCVEGGRVGLSRVGTGGGANAGVGNEFFGTMNQAPTSHPKPYRPRVA